MSFATIVGLYKALPVQSSHEDTVRRLARRLEAKALANGRPMSSKKEFYVYMYLDPTQAEGYSFDLRSGHRISTAHRPLYFGKGRDTNKKQRRSHWHLKEARRILNIRKKGGAVMTNQKTNKIAALLNAGHTPIIKRSELMSEAEAFAREIIFIDGIGRTKLGTGPLLNSTEGGDGITGYRHAREQLALHLFKGEMRTHMEIAKMCGLPVASVKKRIHRGWTDEQLAGATPGHRKHGLIEFDGRTHSAPEWAKLCSIPEKILRKRKKRGWSTEDMLTQPYRIHQNGEYVTQGGYKTRASYPTVGIIN